MGVAAFCTTRRENHFGVCTTLRISTSNYFKEEETGHRGIELCWTRRDSHYYRRVRGRSVHVVPGRLMVLNGLERHAEECSKTSTIPEIRAVIIAPRFIEEVFRDVDLDVDELSFDPLSVSLKPDMRGRLDDLFSLKATPGVSRVAFDCLMTEIAVDLVCRSGTRTARG